MEMEKNSIYHIDTLDNFITRRIGQLVTLAKKINYAELAIEKLNLKKKEQKPKKAYVILYKSTGEKKVSDRGTELMNQLFEIEFAEKEEAIKQDIENYYKQAADTIKDTIDTINKIITDLYGNRENQNRLYSFVLETIKLPNPIEASNIQDYYLKMFHNKIREILVKKEILKKEMIDKFNAKIEAKKKRQLNKELQAQKNKQNKDNRNKGTNRNSNRYKRIRINRFKNKFNKNRRKKFIRRRFNRNRIPNKKQYNRPIRNFKWLRSRYIVKRAMKLVTSRNITRNNRRQFNRNKPFSYQYRNFRKFNNRKQTQYNRKPKQFRITKPNYYVNFRRAKLFKTRIRNRIKKTRSKRRWL